MKKIILVLFSILTVVTMLIGVMVLASAEATDIIAVPELPDIDRPYKTIDELGIDFEAIDACFPQNIEIKYEGSRIYIEDIGGGSVSVSAANSCDLELVDGYWTGDIEGEPRYIYYNSYEDDGEEKYWHLGYNADGSRDPEIVLNDGNVGVYVMFSYEDGNAVVRYNYGDYDYEDRYENGVLKSHAVSNYKDKEVVNQVVYDVNGNLEYCMLLTDTFYYYFEGQGWSSTWDIYTPCDAPTGYEDIDETYFTANKSSLICTEADGDDMVHDLITAYCTSPSICKNGCGYTIAKNEYHTWQVVDGERVCSVCDAVFFPRFEFVDRVYTTVEETGFPYAEYRALFPEVLTVKYTDGKYMIKDVGADLAEACTSSSDYVELELIDGWWIYELDEEIYDDESIDIYIQFSGDHNGKSWKINYFNGDVNGSMSIKSENADHNIQVYYYEYDQIGFFYYVGDRKYKDIYSEGVLSLQEVSRHLGDDSIEIEYHDDGTLSEATIYKNQEWYYYYPETGWQDGMAPEGYENADAEFFTTLLPTAINCVHGADYLEADCTTPERCEICGIAKEGSKPLGHSYDDGVITDHSTCMQAGQMQFTCRNDGNHYYYEDIAIDENAHKWDEGAYTTPPTCLTKGVKAYTCEHNESHTYTEDVDALGHTEKTVAGKAATCTEKGLTDGKKCSVCGEILTAQTEIAALGHKYDNACDADCNACGEERTPAEHVDADENNTCDECGEEPLNDGLSGGAIAGIVIGSVAVLGGGGFALFWFVFRKKRII